MELSVITTVFLGGISTTGGIGSMVGAVLSLLLIGLLRFGMGLANIQGQTQSIAIGLLLVLSILIPNLLRNFSSRKLALNEHTIVLIIVGVVAFGLFWAFFLWSRSVVIPNL
jgi:hypothetical protein